MSESNHGSDAVRSRMDVKSGLFCLALLARQKNHRLSATSLKHEYGHLPELSVSDLVRCCQEVGLSAKTMPLNAKTIQSLPLPAIAVLEDGSYCLLQNVQDDKAHIQRLGADQAVAVELAKLLDIASDQVILASVASEDNTATQDAKFGMKWFFQTVMKYRQVLREVLLASFFIQLFALITPLFFMIIIDKVFAHNNLSTLDVLVFAMVVVTLFDIALNGIRAYLLSHTTNRVDLELGMRLFKHMLALPLSYFESRRMGDTIARIREVETIRNFITGSAVTVFIDLFFVFVFLFVMFLFSKTLALIVVVSMPLFFLVSYALTPLMKSKLEDKHDKLAENQSFLVETIGGIETLKSAAVEPQQQSEWENKLAAYAKCSFNSSILSNLINQSSTLISKGLTVTLLYVGANLVLAGELSVGQLIAFNMLTARVVAPIQKIAQIWQEFTSTRVSVQRVADILDAPTEPLRLMHKTELSPLRGTIQFSDVSFQYASEAPMALEEVTFSVSPGEVIGVVGSTGSGKTTLIKLLQRLYVPSKGKVEIDGNNLVLMDGAWLRKQIGVVAQDFVLFNRSIRDNITLGDYTLDDDKVIAAAKLVGAHELISQLPEGYDTMLQERGRGLSTGQRQSIALARALVTDPAILIFDEATSALDYESEQIFQANFKQISAGRTTFIVAHRLSTVRHANRILTIENGRLVENESPDVLLKTGGRFSKLHAIHNAAWKAS